MNRPDFQILCIDDDANTCNWIRIMLRGSKVAALLTTVKSGREAFDLLSSEEFDLCILDYALPDMTGVQLCSLVRQIGSDVPMMFFTAMNRPIDRERAFASGADAYLSKPDDLNIFVSSVVNLLHRRRPIYVPFNKFTHIPKAA
jgi:CheY-like chemotaxis protein